MNGSSAQIEVVQVSVEELAAKTERAPAREVTFALAIMTQPWIPAHAESLEGLRHLLAQCNYRIVGDRTEQEPLAWEWAASQQADWCVFLQDMAMVPANFWPALRAMIANVPEGVDVVSLHCTHPVAKALAKDNVRFLVTADDVSRVGYVVRAAALRTPAPEGPTPLGCLATGRRVWACLPSLVTTEKEPASVPCEDCGTWVAEDLEAPGFWAGRFKRVHHYAPDGVTYLGHKRAYTNEPEAPRDFGLRDKALADALPYEAARLKALRDDGRWEYQRLAHAARIHRGKPKERVIIATPTRGGVQPQYARTMLAAVSMVECDFEHGFELLETWQWSEDIVRVRSRFLAAALETDCTAVWFVDADVSAHPKVLTGLLQSGHELVAAPYAKRDRIDFERCRKAVQAGFEGPLEAVAYQYTLGMIGGAKLDEASHTMPVDWMPLGCSLMRRGLIERMAKHYRNLDNNRVDLEEVRDVYRRGRMGRSHLEAHVLLMAAELERWRNGSMGTVYWDDDRGTERDTVGLFNLMVRDDSDAKARLLSEDKSFCMRATDMGETIHMYLGPGSPVTHVGEHVYRGSVESFGVSRPPMQGRGSI